MPPAQHNICSSSPPGGEAPSSTAATPSSPPASLEPKVSSQGEVPSQPEVARVPLEEGYTSENGVTQPLHIDTQHGGYMFQPYPVMAVFPAGFNGSSQPIAIPLAAVQQQAYQYMYDTPPQAGSPAPMGQTPSSTGTPSPNVMVEVPTQYEQVQQPANNIVFTSMIPTTTTTQGQAPHPPLMTTYTSPPQEPSQMTYASPSAPQMAYVSPSAPQMAYPTQDTPPLAAPQMIYPAQGTPPVPGPMSYSNQGTPPAQAPPGSTFAQTVNAQSPMMMVSAPPQLQMVMHPSPPYSPAMHTYPSTAPQYSPPQASTPGSFSTVDAYFSAVSPSYSVSGDSFSSSFERLSLNCPAPMYKPPPAHNLRQPTDMAQIWHHAFIEKFVSFQPHQWSLKPLPKGIEKQDSYHIFEDTAKIRFVCENCRHAWTSMQGKVKFWFVLDHKGKAGTVYFKLFGQLCKDCVSQRGCDKIQPAMWYPDEIQKVVHNIHCKVGMIYYNMIRPMLQIQRRIGKPKGQHSTELCQACKDGICRRGMPNPLF